MSPATVTKDCGLMQIVLSVLIAKICQTLSNQIGSAVCGSQQYLGKDGSC